LAGVPIAVTVKATVNAAAPTISSHPQGSAYTVGQAAAALSVTATGSGILSYQWYRNTANSNSGGTLISGATGTSYTPSTATTGTAYYYVIVTNTDATVNGTPTATVTSNPAAVTVNALVHAQPPTISAQPQDADYTVGQTAAALSVTAGVTDGGSLSYQWYYNTANSSSGGTSISGATGASYTPSTATVGTTYYYVVVTNTNSSVNGTPTATAYSNPAGVSVNDPTPPPVIRRLVTIAITTNGTATADPIYTEAGVTVTLTLAPDAGYELDVISVYRTGDAATTVNVSGSGNTRTFTMPAYDVTVSATFKASTGTKSIETSVLRVIAVGDGFLIRGIVPGEMLSVYNIQGQLIYRTEAAHGRDAARHVSTTTTEQRVPVHVRGVYIIVSGERTVKAVY
jgi:hypothetical protein